MQELTNIISDFSDDVNIANSGGNYCVCYFNILTSLSIVITTEGLLRKKTLSDTSDRL